MPDIIMDFERAMRCGIEEAVFCESKQIDQIEEILNMAQSAGKRLLLTRLMPEQFAALLPFWATQLNYNPRACCAVLGETAIKDQKCLIAVVSGGSSDRPVCEEVAATLNYHGIACDLYQDVGVAGLWRLQEKLPALRQYSVIIAVAGMEAALPTVLCGLINAPVIAVPTSVGYGVAKGGQTALNACLASCAGGVMTMNIDNGYGAAVAAIRIYHQIRKFESQ